MKKAATAEKKLAEKVEKAREKSRSKNQSLEMKKLALKNNNASEIGTFKDILLDPPTGDPDEPTPPKALAAARLKTVGTKKAKGQTLTSKRLSLKNGLAIQVPTSPRPRPRRSPTPSLIAIELIRPGKRKVKVPVNAVKSTSSKQMQQVVDS